MELTHQKEKPRAWAIAQGYTPPETQHLWRNLHISMPLWEGSGKFAEDVSGLGLHSGTWGTGLSWIKGDLGTGLDFNYTAQGNFQIPDPPADYLDGCSAFSAELWLEADNVTGTFGLFGKYRASIGLRSWRFYIYNGDIEMQISADGTAYEAKRTTTAPISVGTLYHLVVTYNAGTWACWVNGVSQTTQGNYALTSIYPGTDYVYVGRRYDSLYFDGRIYSIRFWQRQLEAEEIALLYEQPFRMYEPSPDELSWALLHAGSQAAGPWELVSEVDAGIQELYIQNLTNGVSYDVYAKTVDLSGNESTGCTFQSATPAAGGGVYSGLRRGATVAPVVPPVIRRYR